MILLIGLLSMIAPLSHPGLLGGTVPCPQVAVGVVGVLPNLIIPDASACPSFTSHSPIVINGDSGFTAANGVTGGIGTKSSPFLICDWSIDGESFSSAVEVDNTRAYFSICNGSLLGRQNGVLFDNVTNGEILNSFVNSDLAIKIWIDRSSNILVQGNNVSGGICVIGASSENCDSSDSVEVSYSTNVTVSGNTVNPNFGSKDFGVIRSSNITVDGNTFNVHGAEVDNATNVSFTQNAFAPSGIIITAGTAAQLGSLSISSDNLAAGLPILFYKNCSGQNIDGITAGQLIIANCSNVSVSGAHFGTSQFPVQVWRATNVSVSNTRIHFARVAESNGVRIAYNDLTEISLTYVNNDLIVGNNITKLYIFGEALVYHNNFVGNGCHVCGSDPRVTWDNGYPSGGNFYSDYTGVDNCSGPSQNTCPSPDGVGDTPETITGVYFDHYPLMKPFVAGTDPSVSVSFTTGFEGVTVVASGNLSISSGQVSGTVTITATNSSTGATLFSKTYNFSNLQLANNQTRFLLYIPVGTNPLSADITVTESGGVWSASVMVTRQLAITGGGTVGIVDFSIVALDYGSSLGSSRYNPAADLTGSGTINVVDIGIIGLFYGATVFY